MNMEKVIKHAKRMSEVGHTNRKKDGICPWCHYAYCNPKCDLGQIRKAFKGKHQIATVPKEAVEDFVLGKTNSLEM